jgi:hypothetical protein
MTSIGNLAAKTARALRGNAVNFSAMASASPVFAVSWGAQ